MLEIRRTSQFKKDFRREVSNPRNRNLAFELAKVVGLLQQEKVLPDRYQLHRLKGSFVGCFECHIRPDLLLIFQRTDRRTLVLVRLGSHSELFE